MITVTGKRLTPSCINCMKEPVEFRLRFDFNSHIIRLDLCRSCFNLLKYLINNVEKTK